MRAGDEIDGAEPVEPEEPEDQRELDQEAERELDRKADRLVERFQAGDMEAFGELYSLYFERVFRYLRVLLKNTHEAEDIAQQVFLQLMEKLPAYKRTARPFRAWLFVVARNHAINQLRKLNRIEPEDPAVLNHLRERLAVERGEASEDEPPIFGWITDRDLTLFVERLPLSQRQVLLLRFLLDLTVKDTATALDRSESDVKQLQSRALGFLRERLEAVGRKTEEAEEQAKETRKDRSGVREVPKQAPVIRSRRWSLL